jgi:hypothetical protein
MTKAQVRTVMSARQLHQQHQQQHLLNSPLIGLSPWSTNSSALSSPLLSSMALTFTPPQPSFVNPMLDSGKWSSHGLENGHHDDSKGSNESRLPLPTINESNQHPFSRGPVVATENSFRAGGMAVASDFYNGGEVHTFPSPSRATSHSLRLHQYTHLQQQHHYLQQQHYQQQQQQISSNHLLYPGSPAPWLHSDNRHRGHSFDVTRVFTSSSSNGGIKPGQRTLVQNLFKDISAENVWTTTATTTLTNPPATPTFHGSGNSNANTPMSHSPSMSLSASALSPFPSFSTTSRHGLSSPFTFPFLPSSNASSPSQSGAHFTGMARSASASAAAAAVVADEESDTMGTPMLRSAGSSSSSLTNRILRRRDSGNRQSSPNGGVNQGPPEKNGKYYG